VRGLHGRRAAAVVAVAPILLFVTTEASLRVAFDVRHSNVADAVREIDLVSLCAAHTSSCRSLPWTWANAGTRPALLEAWRRDDVLELWRQMKPLMSDAGTQPELVRADYERAWRSLPLAMIDTKLRAFARLLGVRHTWNVAQTTIVHNPFGLAFGPRGAHAREWLVDSTLAVATHPLARWLFDVHLVWLLVGVGWVVALLLGWRRRGRDLATSHAGSSVPIAAVMLLPLAYYASYLAAAPTEDHRFMMPSTLFVQVVSMAAAAAWIGRRRSHERDQHARTP